MLEFQQDNQFYIFNIASPLDNQTCFFQPDFWRNQQRILGEAKGRGTTYFLDTTDLFGVNTALRHYYRGGLWGKINRDLYAFSSLQQTRSFAEFHLLAKLHQAGLPVPKPIGAYVKKTAWGYRADILTEKIELSKDLTALLQTEQLDKSVWLQIGQLIRQLHDLQICHTDLNAHNILVQMNGAEAKCWLIDFDKCGERSGEEWKAGNLQRLHRSFMKEVERMKIQFNSQNWADLLQGYGA